MALKGLEDGGLDLVLLLAEELLRGGVQQVGVLHDFNLDTQKLKQNRKQSQERKKKKKRDE